MLHGRDRGGGGGGGGGRGSGQGLSGGVVGGGCDDGMLIGDDGGVNGTGVVHHRNRHLSHRHTKGDGGMYRSASKRNICYKNNDVGGEEGLEAGEPLLRSPSAARPPAPFQHQGKRASSATPITGRREGFGERCGFASEAGGSGFLVDSTLSHVDGVDGRQVAMDSTAFEFGVNMVSPRKANNDRHTTTV